METVTVTDNAVFARVKLGDIRPNRFRNLKDYPLEPTVIEALKASITESGFWNNLQAIQNEGGTIELRFGHHRLAAGLELFGPEHEIAVEIVPFAGEDSLQIALTYENSVHRNRVAHCHEMVEVRRKWWDDKVFVAYPNWETAIEDHCNYFGNRAGKNPSPILERYFGAEPAGPGNYAQSVKTGVGRVVLARMIPVSEDDIRETMEAQGAITERAKRYQAARKIEEERRAREAREEAESRQREAEEARRQEAEEQERARKEAARIATEKRAVEAEAKAAHDRKTKEAAEQKRRAIAERERQAAEEHRRQLAEKQAATKAAEEEKQKAEAKAKKSTEATQRAETQEWYDERASRVFGDKTAHGAAFRKAVFQPAIQSCLERENLVPFATAVLDELESWANNAAAVTAGNITALVNQHFRAFKATGEIPKREAIVQQEKDQPETKILRLAKEAGQALSQAADKVNTLVSALRDLKVKAANGIGVEAFLNGREKLENALRDFEALSNRGK
jgi:hypothetical protein